LLSYNVKTLHIAFLDALEIQMAGAVAFGIFIPLVAKLAERIGHRNSLILTTALIGAFSFALAPLLKGGEGAILIFAMVSMALMGMTYGLLGTTLAAMFPTRVRYTGASMTFNFSGILGASLAPYIAVWMQTHYGLGAVGLYLLAAAIITLICVLLSYKREAI
jgi:MFS family permease